MLSCEFWETFKNTFFIEHPQATASKILEGVISWSCEFLSHCWLWYLIKTSFFCNLTCSSYYCLRFIFDYLLLEDSATSSWISSQSDNSSDIICQRDGSLADEFEFVWTSHNITSVFLLVTILIILESLAMIMSFDLHSFRTFVCFLYKIKDSDKCFDDSSLKAFTSSLIFLLIIFFRSVIIVFKV